MDQDKIQEYNDKLKADSEKLEHKQELEQTINATKDSANAIIKAVAGEAQRTRQSTQKVKSVDPIASPQDIAKVVTGLGKVADKIQPVDQSELIAGLNTVAKRISELPKTLPQIEFPEPPETTKVSNLAEIKPWLEQLSKAIAKIDVRPEVNVDAPKIDIPQTQVNIDIDKIVKKLDEVAKAAKSEPQEKIDLSKLEKATKSVKDAINGLSFPVPNYVLPFKDDRGATQVELINGGLPTPVLDLQVDDTGTYTYLGNATPGTATSEASWRIKRVTNATGVITHADGSSLFNKEWDERASYSY